MRTVLLTRRVKGPRVYRKRQWIGAQMWILVVYVGTTQYNFAAQRGKGVWLAGRKSQGGVVVPINRSVTSGRLLVKKVKRAGEGVPVTKHLAALESVLFGRLQAIISHLAIMQYDDGEPRRPGWITLKTLGAAWVVEAKDPDSCSKLTVVQDTLDNALAALCLLLESDECPWEPDQWLMDAAAKKKAKK